MKKYALAAASLALAATAFAWPARANVSPPPPPGAGVAYINGFGGASPGLVDPTAPGTIDDPTNLWMQGQATGQAIGRQGVSGMSAFCSFSVTETLATAGRLTGDCGGGLDISGCDMAWVRVGLQAHAYGRCNVMGSPTGMALEVTIKPTAIHPTDMFAFIATMAPAGEAVI